MSLLRTRGLRAGLRRLFLPAVLLSCLAVSIGSASAATVLTTLHSCLPTGTNPYARLIVGSDGTLYGTAISGGVNAKGTLYAISPGGVFTTLHQFSATDSNGHNTDGVTPYGGLTLSSDGSTLYGAAYGGGAHNAGTIFKINTDGTGFSVLQNCSLDVAYPQCSLLPLSEGGVTTLFGTGLKGGNGYGMVFGMNTAGSITVSNIVSGRYFCAGLTSNGNPTSTATLYGVSEYDPSGLAGGYTFSTPTGGGSASYYSLTAATTGGYVGAGLTRIGTHYYGAAMGGGANGKGTIFLNGTAAALYSFNTTDGAYPECRLALIGSTLYGTTTSGGTNGKGTLFGIGANGTGFTDLHDFTGADGQMPIAGPVLGSSGLLYGTAVYGGVSGKGTLYSFNPTGSGFQWLYSFSGTDGASPVGGLVEDPNALGTFYGTTEYGGAYNFGSVYSLVP